MARVTLPSERGAGVWARAATRRLDRRHQALAELEAATLRHCAYCIDLGSEPALHRSGDAPARLAQDRRS